MKKLTSVLLSAALLSSLAGCSSGEAAAPSAKPDDAGSKTYNIAVVKQLDHASLDEIANAVTAELDALAASEGVVINYEVYSGQNDQTVLKQIGDQAVSDNVDAIIPIATLAAQTMVVCASDKQIPVIFAAVSDPAGADLTGFDFVTGTSDALNTNQIMDMMFAVDPEIKKVGLLYSLSEVNSLLPIAEAKAYLDSKNIPYEEMTGNTNDEIIAAASGLIAGGVDAVFTPTDNVVMAAELAVAPAFYEAGIPHYTGADSFVRNGAFSTCGVNYTDLGKKTADYAYQAITEGMADMEDFYLMDGGIVTVNTDTAGELGLDYYAALVQFGELVEITTTED